MPSCAYQRISSTPGHSTKRGGAPSTALIERTSAAAAAWVSSDWAGGWHCSTSTVTVEVLQCQPPAQSDETHAAAAALVRSISAVEGAPPRFVLCPGVLEIRWYAQLGIPAFAYGG